MTLPASGAISLSQVNVELGLSATAQIGMNDAAVRTLFGVPSGAISMSDGYGKANQFAFAIASNQTNANLRTLALNAGWNGTSKVVATINSGIYVSSNSTGTPALTVNGSFPNGVELVNNGFIVGRGGNGGTGGGLTNGGGGINGSAGSTGGLALSVSTTISIRNNGTVGGGGGGGGGGANDITSSGKSLLYYGGGGGGGGRSSTTNSSGGAGGYAFHGSGGTGGAGTTASAGAGGSRGGGAGGLGGGGGGWGATGSSGTNGTTPETPSGLRGPYSGGAGGAAVSGNSNITWLAFGTRLGAIT